MSKHVYQKNKENSKRKTLISWGTALKSERLFNKFIVAAHEQGLLQLTEKQYKNAKSLNAYAVNSHSINRMIMNSACSTTKLINIITTKIPHSPLKEANDASIRQRESMFILNTITKISEHKFKVQEPFFYMVTFTIPNVDEGHLNAALKKLAKDVSAINKAFKDGAKNNNGLQLGMAKWLGAYVSIEITVNRHQLKKEESKGIYHPHAHVIVVFDKPLNFSPVMITRKEVPNMTQDSTYKKAAEAILFKYWAQKNRKLQLSPDAFQIETCYNNEKDYLSGVVAEATKYVMKPNLYKYLPSIPTPFSVKIFAELFNSMKGKTFKRNAGVFNEAKGFFRCLSKNKIFSSAVLSSSFHKQKSDYVPAIFTKIGNFDFDKSKYRYRLNNVSEMSDDMLIQFNQALIGNVGFDQKLFRQIKWSIKNKLYQYLLKELCFVKRKKAGIIAMLNNWITIQKNKISTKPRSESLRLQMVDILRLKTAVENTLDKYGNYQFKIDYGVRFKLLRVLDVMASIERKANSKMYSSDVVKKFGEDDVTLFISNFLVKNGKFAGMSILQNVYENFKLLGRQRYEKLILQKTDLQLSKLSIKNCGKNFSGTFDEEVMLNAWLFMNYVGWGDRSKRQFSVNCRIENANQLQEIINKM